MSLVLNTLSCVHLCLYLQGFIQALLLTSVCHEGLSFMAMGHNLMCIISMLTLAAGGSYGICNPPRFYPQDFEILGWCPARFYLQDFEILGW